MAEQIEMSDLIPASPERVYRAWMDAGEHAAMTGGRATVEDVVGGRFSAWDGYISGENVELEVGRRIVQTWRSKDFPDDAPNSRLEIRFEESEGGTRITLLQSQIPDGQSEDYAQGWRDHYFTPMRRYFSTHAERNGETAPLPTAAPPPEVDMGWEEPAAPKPKAKAKAKGKKAIKTSQATGIKAKRSVKPAPKLSKDAKKAATRAATKKLKKKAPPKPARKSKPKAAKNKKGRR